MSNDDDPPYVIWLDLPITRRKIYHSVLDPGGARVFSSRFLSECLAYLDAEGVTEYVLVPRGDRTLGANLPRHTVRKVDQWQN